MEKLKVQLKDNPQKLNKEIMELYKKYNIKGITFYPENSGTKLIYLFDKQDDKIKNELLAGNAKIIENADPDDNLHLVENSEKKKKTGKILLNRANSFGCQLVDMPTHHSF